MISQAIRSLALPALILVIAGCYHPYPNQQPYGYTQPGYAPPQSFAPQQAPGQLVIPPSNAPLYQPGGGPIIDNGSLYNDNSTTPRTYDDDDGFDRSNNSGSGRQFYGGEADGVPLPPAERSDFDNDF